MRGYMYVISERPHRWTQFLPDLEIKSTKSTTLVSVDFLKDFSPKGRCLTSLSPRFRRCAR